MGTSRREGRLPRMRRLQFLRISALPEKTQCCRNYALHRKSELLQYLIARRTGAVVINGEDDALVPRPPVPPHAGCRLHTYTFAKRGRQHVVAILGRLTQEEFPTRHAHHTSLHAKFF